MKKRFFAIIATVLLVSNSLNVNAYSIVIDGGYDKCITVANNREKLALQAGFTTSQAYEMGNNAFDSCVDTVNILAAINNN